MGGHRDAAAHRHQRFGEPAGLPQRHQPLRPGDLGGGIAAQTPWRGSPAHRIPYVAGFVQTALAALVVIAFSIAGADPFRQLLIWSTRPACWHLGLQVAVAISVPVYFRRTPNNEGPWRTTIAPLLPLQRCWSRCT